MCILGASAGGGNTNGRGGGIAAAVRKIVRGSLDPQPVKGAGSPLRAGGQLGFLYTSSSMAAASSKPPASSRFGASQEYPLATAASMNSSSRKWVLNGKNDVVEVVDAYHLMNSPYQQQQQQQQQQQGYLGECGRLMRYNSAPSSLLSDLDHMARSLNESSGNNSHNGNPAIFNNDLPPLPTTLGLDKRNPLVDPFSNNNNNAMAPSTSRFSGQSSGVSLGMGNVGMDHAGAGFGVDSNHGFTGLLTGSSTMTTAGLSPACSMQATTMATPPQVVKTGNLIRQSSSPASLLSRLEIDHQVGHAGTGSSEEDSPLLRSPNDAMSADDMLGGGMELGGVDCGFWDGSNSAAVAAAVGHGSLFMNSTIRKRIRDEVSDIDTTHQQQQQQHTLTRHLSLPISTRSGNILPENLLQDAVPCRLRAKRGCATHPRSIAERVRRTRITERMRKLQELVPNSDKQQTNTSDMLDEAVEYVKYLQRRNEELLQELSECRDKCQGLCKMSNASQ